MRDTFSELARTLGRIWRDRRLRLFMLAFFCYIDGVHTIIKMSTSYGTDLGIDSTQLVLALLVTQFVAFPSAIAYGRLAGRFGTKRMLLVAIGAYLCITLFAAFFLRSAVEFWVLAVCVGLFQGGIQALSRSEFGKLIPKDRANEYYGFFDIFGKYAAVMGTFLVSVFTQLTGNSSVGVLSIAALFVLGFVLLAKMPEGRGVARRLGLGRRAGGGRGRDRGVQLAQRAGPGACGERCSTAKRRRLCQAGIDASPCSPSLEPTFLGAGVLEGPP